MGRFAVVFALVLPALSPAGHGGESLSFRVEPETSRISFTLDATAHTVEGSFDVRSGFVRLDTSTGELSGEVVVDLTTGVTGNDRRDRKMHEEVLESERYPTAVLRPERLVGSLREAGQADVQIEGSLSLHGEDHGITIPVRVTIEGDVIAISASLRIPYVDWGLDDPSFFVLRVAKEVLVRVELEGSLSRSSSFANP